jgi:tRNA 5-methylaminomethyl-2-thiouridine biosynthesis bifunctional protein
LTHPLRNARLVWDDGLPRSVEYGDIYYSQADALGESQYVFLHGNDLPARFATLATRLFVIGELGFGAGLNFLTTCQLWCKTASSRSTLHYLACELNPFALDDLRRLYSHFPSLQAFSETFLCQYPDHTAGVHQMTLLFNQHRVVLTLLYGDARTQLPDLLAHTALRVDAWFLDGFSPRCNPALWEPALLACMGGVSGPGTTLSTYSAASVVRGNLQAAGFDVTRLQGFAGKRHMVRARWQAGAADTHPTPPSARRAIVVGGGMAGCCTAWTLAGLGWQVDLLEKHGHLAAAGSGNRQAVLHCKPGTAQTPDNDFNLHAYVHAFRHYQLLRQLGFAWHECGMLHLGFNDEQRRRFERLAACERFHPSVMQQVDKAAASSLAGVALEHPALYFPQSGWLSPRALCDFYREQAGFRVHTDVVVTALQPTAAGWQLQDARGQQFAAEVVILCAAGDLYDFPPCRGLPLIANRGQVDVYAAQPQTTLRTVLCGQGYLTPASAGLQSLGGSFHAAALSLEQNRLQHLALLSRMDGALADTLAKQRPLEQRSGLRCQTPDRMPLVGPVSAELPGLFVNAAHGSNGLARIPVAAALLASLIEGTPPPLPASLRRLLAPERFR